MNKTFAGKFSICRLRLHTDWLMWMRVVSFVVVRLWVCVFRNLLFKISSPPLFNSLIFNFSHHVLPSHLHEEERTGSTLLSGFNIRCGHQPPDALDLWLSSADDGTGNRRLSSFAEVAHIPASVADCPPFGRPVRRNPSEPIETHKSVSGPSYLCHRLLTESVDGIYSFWCRNE